MDKYYPDGDKASINTGYRKCCGQNVVTQRLMAVPEPRSSVLSRRYHSNSTAAGPAAAPQQKAEVRNTIERHNHYDEY
jgi:hypothetical protein